MNTLNKVLIRPMIVIKGVDQPGVFICGFTIT
jgi:hypothetical protein